MPMKDLSERDVHRALAVVAAAAADGNGIAFGIETVDAILAAIPADEAAYVEWRFGDRESIRIARGEDEPPWLDEALAATCGSYPLRDIDHTTSVEPLRISDAVSRAFAEEPLLPVRDAAVGPRTRAEVVASGASRPRALLRAR